MNQTFIAALLGLAAVASVIYRKSSKPKPLRWPLAVNKINQAYGNRTHPVTKQQQFHNGVDLAATSGTVVACPADGVVQALFSDATGGNQLIIRHNNGYHTGYAHLSRYKVALYEIVLQSQVIAFTGNTGRTTGPHLHFTVRDAKGYVNPVDYCS